MSLITQIYFWNKTLYVSDRFADSLRASCQQTCMTYAIAVCTVKKTPDDWQRNCPKHIQFYSKNKFEKLVPSSWFYYNKCAFVGSL